MSAEDVKCDVKNEDGDKPCQLSPNCLNFTRMFHNSFDEDSSNSSNSIANSSGHPKVEHKFKSEPPDEIILEIEIETTSEEVDENLLQTIKTDFSFMTKEKFSISDAIINHNDINDANSSINTHLKSAKNKELKTDENEECTSSISSDETEFDLNNDDIQLGSTTHENGQRKSNRLPHRSTFCKKTHEAQIMKQISLILKKDPLTLTDKDSSILSSFPTLVTIVQKRSTARTLSLSRSQEFEDSEPILSIKISQLASIVQRARHLVVYSGAGISTSADIPDYRGPRGIWTLLKNGQSLESGSHKVLTSADPTLTHMAIKELYERGIVKHVVSQNCDGLHLRSGIPKTALSEVHGNMYIEVCVKCSREYVRLFDVTENTRRYEHRTGRVCYTCSSPLHDSVVHFGERGSLKWPLNWSGAQKNANGADVILCLGSSLKVLRRYPWLWCMEQPKNTRPQLVIVNLQWTPKDQFSLLKIHGKCDEVMRRLMSLLNITIPIYSRHLDSLFTLFTPLHESETEPKLSRSLLYPPSTPLPPKSVDSANYSPFQPRFVRRRGGRGLSEEESETGVSTRAALKLKQGRKKRVFKKGNGSGWLGNAWGVKPKKRKLK